MAIHRTSASCLTVSTLSLSHAVVARGVCNLNRLRIHIVLCEFVRLTNGTLHRFDNQPARFLRPLVFLQELDPADPLDLAFLRFASFFGTVQF